MNARLPFPVLPRHPVVQGAVAVLVALPLTVIGLLGVGVVAAEMAVTGRGPSRRDPAAGPTHAASGAPAAD